MLKHFVITRLGLCVYSEQRLSAIIDLFEAITLPSLVRQTDQGFVWLLVVDAEIPPAAPGVDDLLRAHQFHRCDRRDPAAITAGAAWLDLGSLRDFVLERGLLTSPATTYHLVDRRRRAWHCAAISSVNRFMADRLPHARWRGAPRDRLRHTGNRRRFRAATAGVPATSWSRWNIIREHGGVRSRSVLQQDLHARAGTGWRSYCGCSH